MKRFKIGIVIDQLLAGGVQLSAIEQIRELQRRGYVVELIILMRKKYPTDFSYLVKNIPHRYLSDEYPRIFQKTIKLPFFSFLSTLHLVSPFLAPRVIKNKQYDVLLSWGTTTCLTTQSLFRKRHIPYLAVIHDPIEYILDKVYAQTSLRYFFWILRPLGRYFEESFIRDAKKTLIISSVHKEYLQKKYAISPRIISLSVDVAQKKLPLGDGILSFGRWQKDKHPELLLDILEKIENSKLIIAGSWIKQKDLDWFRQIIVNRKLQNRVTLIPHFTAVELRRVALKSRVFIHPHFEAFGLAALEAAALGLPIIIPHQSGVTENFIHGTHGYFPKTQSEFLFYTKKIVSNKNLAQKMGHAAQAKVGQTFSWEKHIDQVIETIEEIHFEKPRIAIVEICHVFGNALSGGDKLMEPMAQRLRSEYNFTVIVSKGGEAHWKQAALPKKIITLSQNIFDNSGQPVPIFLTYVLRMIQTIRYLLTQESDTIYSSTNILPDVLPAFICKRNTIWIARIHHLIPPPNKRPGRVFVNIVSYAMQRLALELIKKGADTIIALNETLRKDLLKKGFNKDKIFVLGGGISSAYIKKIEPTDKTQHFSGIYVGRLHSAKGIFDLVTIWKKVIEKIPNAQLAIIGTGAPAEKKALQEQIIANYLTKQIALLGFASDKKLYQLLKRAKVFLFTDHEAGWGLAAAEAMAAGLPVVGYDIGILGSVFKTGYRKVPLNDITAFARAVITFLRNEKMWNKVSAESLAESEKFDWSKTTNEFRKILINAA